MKELSLHEIWDVSLEILVEVDGFCRKNNIRYSLAGGTLLGAVRHSGFIPWDDDIDLMMPRPDFEKFCKTYNGINTKCFSIANGNSYMTFARVCDTKKTFAHSYLPWATEPTGVWIDVFPLDGIADKKEIFLSKRSQIDKLYEKMYLTRSKYARFSFKNPLIWNVKVLIKKILYNKNDYFELMRDYWDTVNASDFNSSNYCGQLAFPCYYPKEYYPTKWFNEFEEMQFCGKSFRGIKDYDAYLKNYFGDYMQLPPEDQRVAKHSQHIFYWK